MSVRPVSRDCLSLNPELLICETATRVPRSAQALAASQRSPHTSSMDTMLVPGASRQSRPLGRLHAQPPITDIQPRKHGAQRWKQRSIDCFLRLIS